MDANSGGGVDGDGTRASGFNPYAAPGPVDEVIDEGAPVGPLPGSPRGLSVTYRNNAADIAAYVNYYTSKFTKHRRNLRVIMGFILTALVLQTVAFRNVALEGYRAPIMIGGMVVVWVWLEFALSRRKLGQPVEMPMVTLTLTPSGIVTREENGGGTHRAWSAIKQVDNTDDHIYIFEDADKTRVVMAHVVPRRAFSTAEAADEFLETARRWHAEPEGRQAFEQGAEPDEDGLVDWPDDGLAVTFTMGPDDRRAELAFYRSQQPDVQTSKFGLLFGAIGGTAVFLVVSSRDGSPLWVNLVPLVLVYLVVGFLWWRMRAPTLPKVEEGAEGPITVRINPDGYEVHRGGINETSQSWRLVSGVGSNDDFFIFPRALSPDGSKVLEACLVPRRAFASPEAAEEFLRGARRWHGEATGQRPRL